MRNKANLDFDALQDIPNGTIYWSLTPPLRDNLAAVLPKTAEGFHGALYLASLIGIERNETILSLDEQLRRSEVCFRGFLAEFARLDRVIADEYSSLGLRDPPAALRSPHPAIHLFKMIRNLELHLAASTMSSKDADFDFGRGDDKTTITITLLLVNDLSLSRLRKLDSARYYGTAALAKMIDWFERNQEIWGINEVIRFTSQRFAQFIFDDLASRRDSPAI